MNWPLPIVPRGAETRGMVSHRCARHPLFTSTLFTDEVIVASSALVARVSSASYRDLSELARELGVRVAPSTILRWVVCYAPPEPRYEAFQAQLLPLSISQARYWFVTDRRTRPQRHISRIRAATSACAEAPHALASSTKSTGQVRHSKRSRMLSGINRLRGANTYESP
jgi:hypothetical protein